MQDATQINVVYQEEIMHQVTVYANVFGFFWIHIQFFAKKQKDAIKPNCVFAILHEDIVFADSSFGLAQTTNRNTN